MKEILNFINNEFVATSEQFDERTPIGNRVPKRVHEAGKAEIDSATAAAKPSVSSPWAQMSVTRP